MVDGGLRILIPPTEGNAEYITRSGNGIEVVAESLIIDRRTNNALGDISPTALMMNGDFPSVRSVSVDGEVHSLVARIDQVWKRPVHDLDLVRVNGRRKRV